MTTQNLQCPYCPKTSTRGTGLASHIRGVHSDQYSSWSANRKAGVTVSTARPVASPSTGNFSGGMALIIRSLEQQKAAIDRALLALEGLSLETAAAPKEASPQAPHPTTTRRKGGMTEEGRQRLADSMKRRWAAKRTAAQANRGSRKRRAA